MQLFGVVITLSKICHFRVKDNFLSTISKCGLSNVFSMILMKELRGIEIFSCIPNKGLNCFVKDSVVLVFDHRYLVYLMANMQF